MLEHVRCLKSSGVALYCWSSGGASTAQGRARAFGIEDCFEAILPKPNVTIDDPSVADGRLCLGVHPLSIDDKGAPDYWDEITTRSA